jgi:hypothetical protein
MTTTIRDTDLFITERLEVNHRVEAQDLRSFVGIFNPGTKLLFNNPTAPLGWTHVGTGTTDNSALRIVKTGGGNTGTGQNFTATFATVTIKASKHKHAVSESNHTHTANLGNHGHGMTDPGHTHGLKNSRAVHQHQTQVTPKQASGGMKNSLHVCFGNQDGNFSPPEVSSTETGDPSAAGPGSSGISIGGKTAGFTSGNNTGLGISVNNAGSTVQWNLNIKYNDFMICSKDNF